VVEASRINVALLFERAATHPRPDASRGLVPDADVVVAARRRRAGLTTAPGRRGPVPVAPTAAAREPRQDA
jgi:hypothetical protein